MESETIVKENLKLTGFHPVDINSIPVLKKYFTLYPERSCDFSIGGTLMWSDYFHYRYCEVENTLFIAGKIPESDTMLFYKPIGELDYNTCENLIRRYAEIQKRDACILLPIESQPGDQSEIKENTVETPFIDDWKEYLYDASKFVAFSGRKMEKKRNHLNFFRNHYSEFVIEPISKKNISDIIAFTRNHLADHSDYLFRYENASCINSLMNYDTMGFEGIAIRINGKIIGYTFGELTGDTFHIHAEKGNINYRGIYQALASSLCNEMLKLHPEIRYLNREEDMGVEELRHSKESYHPSLYTMKKLKSLFTFKPE